jgi:hypothetical protein
MDTHEHEDWVPAGLVRLATMVDRTADHRYGTGWRGNIKVENTLGRPGGEFRVTILEPSIEIGLEVEELICAAAADGILLIHFPDGQRPPLWYWRSDSGLESIKRGYFVARYSGILPDYDGKELYAGEVNFARWLAGVPKHEATPAQGGPKVVVSKRRHRPKREAVAEVLGAVYGERDKWPKTSKHVLDQVNNLLRAQGFKEVSIFTLRRTIDGE